MGLAEAARNGYKEKTFLNSTRPSDSMAWFDSEIPEAQLASSSACAVNLSTAESQSFTAPGASSDWNCISNVHRAAKACIDLQLTCLTLSTYNVSSEDRETGLEKNRPIPTNFLP